MRMNACQVSTKSDQLQENARDRDKKPKGAGWNGKWNAKEQRWDWQDYSTFEQAIASIREAAVWYEKVGGLGYGVWAWY